MIGPKTWLRRILCRVGWDAACDNNTSEIEEQRARMQALTWQFRALARRVIEGE